MVAASRAGLDPVVSPCFCQHGVALWLHNSRHASWAGAVFSTSDKKPATLALSALYSAIWHGFKQAPGLFKPDSYNTARVYSANPLHPTTRTRSLVEQTLFETMRVRSNTERYSRP